MSREIRFGRSVRAMRGLGGTALAAAIVAAALMATAPSASAATGRQPAGFQTQTTPAAQRAAQADAAREFWTPQRMRAAKPLDGTAQPGVMPSATAARSSAGTQPDTYVPPALPPSEGLVAVGVTSTVGRVFFVDSSGAIDSCSGVSVTSEAGDMVLTAGHCVYGGPQFNNNPGTVRGWYQQWVYVPGYYVDANGVAHEPYGSFDAWSMSVTNAWYDTADLTGDIGIVLVGTNAGGHKLVPTYGGQGLTWDQGVNQTVTAYGYSVNPNNPSAPVGVSTCVSTLGRYGGTGPYGDIACGLTAGASGGPWLIDTDPWGMGLVTGINSWTTMGIMFSPWFSSTNVLGMYTALRNL